MFVYKLCIGLDYRWMQNLQSYTQLGVHQMSRSQSFFGPEPRDPCLNRISQGSIFIWSSYNCPLIIRAVSVWSTGILFYECQRIVNDAFEVWGETPIVMILLFVWEWLWMLATLSLLFGPYLWIKLNISQPCKALLESYNVNIHCIYCT